jgi:hypothetical protein
VRKKAKDGKSSDIMNDKVIENFLITIQSYNMTINDQECVMTFIKDITFGVIHEQVKARERLKNIVVGTLKKNIDEPLTSLISNCEVLKDSDEL